MKTKGKAIQKEYSILNRIVATRDLTKIALMGCLLFVVFSSFSQILYLEAITLVVVVFGFVFPAKHAVTASAVFAFLNMLVQGVTIFTMMYLFVYMSYSLITCLCKGFLRKHQALIPLFVGFLSFLTGQLLDLPFMLLSARATLVYLLLGLKTSLIQGSISGIMALFLFDPLYQNLMRIERKFIK